jgi:hypothetical protein
MGQELTCMASFKGRRCEGKALLETSEILFRGDFRLKIPLQDIRALDASSGKLHVEFGEGSAVFELGEAAEKWLQRIRNPRSRAEKLGIKPGQRVCVIGLDDAAFLAELKGANAALAETATPSSDQIFFSAPKAADLKKLAQLKKSLAPTGALWVLRPKGSKDISEAQVREAAKAAGLVDVKVVAFSQALSAEKLMIPVAKRN